MQLIIFDVVLKKRRFFLSLASIIILSSFDIPDIIEEPPPKPFIEIPEFEVEQKEIDKLLSKKNKKAKDYYLLSLYLIQAHRFSEAKDNLNEALLLDSSYLDAIIELGYVNLWEDNKKMAQELFERALSVKPCEITAQEGLLLVARELPLNEAIEIYEKVLNCDANNADALFLLANAYRREKKYDQAETLLNKLLKKQSNNQEALIELAYLYSNQKKPNELKELYLSNQDNQEIAYIYGSYLFEEEKISEAYPIYLSLKKDQKIYKQLFELKSRKNSSIGVDANYTDAKEWDPTINKPVVKDYYFLFDVKANFPINDVFRLDTKSFYYHQRENQIYPPIGVNYSVYELGAEVRGHYYFLPKWKLDVYGKGYRAWGAQVAKYPFQNVTRFETGTSVSLNSDHLFIADGHIEYFVIKNYNLNVSQLLRTDYIQGTYGYRPQVYLNPQAEAFAQVVYYHDQYDNIKRKGSLKAGFDLFTPYLSTFYLFEYGAFKYLNQNYFSYKRQTRSTVEVRLHKEFDSNYLAELIWDHTWELTKNLYLPIGDTVYVASRLYLIWNIYTAKFSFRIRDQLKCELSGHYLYNTLPYYDWNGKASLTWQF